MNDDDGLDRHKQSGKISSRIIQTQIRIKNSIRLSTKALKIFRPRKKY